jgi:hypothetical protein
MNNSRVFAVIMLLAAIVGCSQEASADMKDGTIIFSQNADGGGNKCTVPTVPPKDQNPKFKLGDTYEVSMRDNKFGCDNDVYNYVRLEGVPSATKIELISDICPDTDVKEWYFALTTIVQPTTTGLLYIGSISDSSAGGVVTPGLRLDEKRVNDPGDFKNEFSCVKITRSQLPLF